MRSMLALQPIILGPCPPKLCALPGPNVRLPPSCLDPHTMLPTALHACHHLLLPQDMAGLRQRYDVLSEQLGGVGGRLGDVQAALEALNKRVEANANKWAAGL